MKPRIHILKKSRRHSPRMEQSHTREIAQPSFNLYPANVEYMGVLLKGLVGSRVSVCTQI
jgi:hypothetical protein